MATLGKRSRAKKKPPTIPTSVTRAASISDTKVAAKPVSASTTKRPSVLHELGGGRPARFEQWVDSIDGSSEPTLYFKHVLLPHVPFQYLPSGRRYRTSRGGISPWVVLWGLNELSRGSRGGGWGGGSGWGGGGGFGGGGGGFSGGGGSFGGGGASGGW